MVLLDSTQSFFLQVLFTAATLTLLLLFASVIADSDGSWRFLGAFVADLNENHDGTLRSIVFSTIGMGIRAEAFRVPGGRHPWDGLCYTSAPYMTRLQRKHLIRSIDFRAGRRQFLDLFGSGAVGLEDDI